MPARTIGRVAATAPPRTWILHGSPETFAVTRELGLGLVGLKERDRRLALEIERGDRIVYYITRVMAFAASARVSGELFEDRTPVWPGKPGKVDPYPWRFEAEPELLLDEPDWVPARSLVDPPAPTGKRPHGPRTLAVPGPLR